MSDEPTVVAAGERGPTGDHGQPGDRGRRGETGREGVPGLEGPAGHTGQTGQAAPRRSVAVVVLLAVTGIMALVIIGAALRVALNAQQDEGRLVADRDAVRAENAALLEEVSELRDQVDEILTDQLAERESDACFEAYTAVMSSTAQHTRALAARMNAAMNLGLLSLVDNAPPEATIDPDLIVELIEEADAAAIADEAANQAREDWVAAGRPLPCPLNP